MSTLTTGFFINQANSFVADVRDTRNSYFVFAGKASAWPDDNNPPAADDSVTQSELTVFQNIMFGKLLETNDVSLMIPRYNWTSNTAYSMYDQDDPDLHVKNFFVVNDQFQVFKCVFNNRGGNSVVQPRLTSTSGTFKTADGYVWKYMFSVDSQANTKFTSASYIPVTANAAVQAAAVGGTIDAYKVANGGQGYQVYETGFIDSQIDRFTIQLPTTSSANDNFYAKSSIYLKSGFGAGQIREITSYNGASKQLRVATLNPFETFYKIDFVAAPVATVEPGYYVEQVYDRIEYLFMSNNRSFHTGMDIVQSDTGVIGTVLSANSSVLRVQRANNTPFLLDLPFRDTAEDGTIKVGTVNVTNASSNVIGTSTQFTDVANGYVVGDYIRVGSNTSAQIRRVTSVTNSTFLSVTPAFSATLVANVHYFVPEAAQPSSITINKANGVISNTNLNSLILTVNNSSLPGQPFIPGELVNQVTSANVSAGANGIVAFSNTSTVLISGVTGSWTANLFVRGTSSLQRFQIQSLDSNPNVVLREPAGTFVPGFPTVIKTSPISTPVTNAVIKAVTTIPNDQTEYVIAPTVSVGGDGSNARAIAVVNTALGSAREITAIDVINVGSGYSFANVSIYANNSFGSGAQATAVIGPKLGHGYEPIYELGARYVGINKVFNTGAIEGFFFPTYGSFRSIGIIENPQFADVRITLKDFDYVNLEINNKVTSSANISITNWAPGEVVIQNTSNAAGLVVSGNATNLQLKNVLGTFQTGNVQIRGIFSNTTANVASALPVRFEITSDSSAEIVSQLTSGAQGEVVQILSNTEIVLSNVVGKFVVGDTLMDPTINAHAIVNTIATANGSRDVTVTFGTKFNQTARVTLSSNVGAYTNGEFVVQDLTSAYGVIVSDRDELDLAVTVANGTFTTGQKVTSANSGATGYITSSNSTYIKLTGVSQNASFSIGHAINNELASQATINNVYAVLLLNNVDGPNRFQATPNNIVGQTSGATGVCNSYSNLLYPELVRDTGRVLYIDNIEPVTRTDISKEEIRLVVKF